MIGLACPVACPLAWSTGAGSGRCGAALEGGLPANDSVGVRPGMVACAWRRGGGTASCAGRSGGQRGEVISCPLARPFPSSCSLLPALPSHLPVPAKEKKNEVQLRSERP